ncbi:MAG TPA: glycosyltransferase family 39 protein [bacterium]|nr:glycosyltransferase family 39 protein [bacterium]
MDKKKTNLLLTASVLSTGIFLRFLFLGRRSFWCDEFLAISLGKLSLTDMKKWVMVNDAHPPFFYAIFHFLLKFTESEAGLRFLPAILGAGAVLLFCLLLKRFGEKRYFYPALVLCAISPAAVLWSQMVKSYSMLTFFSLLSTYFFFAILESRKMKNSFMWIPATVIMLYLHNYGIIIFAAQMVTLFLHKGKKPLKFFMIPVSVIILSYLPYIAGPLFSQISFVKGAAHSVTNPFLRLGYAFYYFVFGETLSPLNFILVIPGGIIFASFFIKGFFSRDGNLLKRFSVIVLAISAALFFMVAATIPQNLMHLQPFFFVIVVSGLNFKAPAGAKKVFAFLLASFLLPPLYFYYKRDASQYHDVSKLIPYREISRTINREGKGGDAVIFTEPRERRFEEFYPPYSPWDWYYKGDIPLLEINPASVKNLDRELEKIKEEHVGLWLLLNYGFTEREWNESLKNFVLKRKSVKIKEEKLLKNYSFLDILKGEEKRDYYFLELYHIKRAKNE